MYTNRVFGTAKSVLFIEVSSPQEGVLIEGMAIHVQQSLTATYLCV